MNSKFIFTALVLFLAIGVAQGFASTPELYITETTTPFNFQDLGNATQLNSTLWAYIAHGGSVGYNSNYTNVTFVLPFGINPKDPGLCNATQQRIIGGSNSSPLGSTASGADNRTFNLTHQMCTIGYWNMSAAAAGGTAAVNVTLNVTANLSALTMNHIARGTSTVPALIYVIMNATNNTSDSNYGVVSAPTQHNSTSFWINPRPYAYTAGDAASNGTVYIIKFNQTRNGYQVMAPLMSYNSTLGYPTTTSNAFAEIMYFDRTPMEAASANDSGDPMYMELFSYNLTFRIIAPFAANGSAVQTYYINSPVNGSGSNASLMPLLIRQETVPGMMGKSMTQIMGVPSQSGFTIYYGNGIYTNSNLSSIKGVNISFTPAYNTVIPLLTITSSNVSALNNTDITLLLTLTNMQAQGSASPIYIQGQRISGFDMTAPPKLGENVTTTFLINISNALANYTLNNLTIRFMMPINATVLNGSSSGATANISNRDNATFAYSNRSAAAPYAQGWSIAENYTKNVEMLDRAPGSAQGTNVSVWFQFIDVPLNGSFNSWVPGGGSYGALNFTTYMSFPTMNMSNNTPGTAGTSNTFNATIQMPMKGRLNLTDKVPGFTSSGMPSYSVQLDGQTLSAVDGNMTIGSLLLNNVDSGSHSVSISYSLSAQGTSPSGGGGAGAGGAAGAGCVLDVSKMEGTCSLIQGESVTVKFSTTESHKITNKEVTGGSFATFTITSTPITVTAQVGVPKYVDVDGDNVNDLKLLVNSISGTTVDVTITKLRSAKEAAAVTPPAESVTPAETGGAVEQAPEEETAALEKAAAPKLSVTTILAILLIALIIVGVYFYYKKEG